MMLRIHDFDVRPARLPELRQTFDDAQLGVAQRCKNAPSVLEQFGKSRFRT